MYAKRSNLHAKDLVVHVRKHKNNWAAYNKCVSLLTNQIQCWRWTLLSYWREKTVQRRTAWCTTQDFSPSSQAHDVQFTFIHLRLGVGHPLVPSLQCELLSWSYTITGLVDLQITKVNRNLTCSGLGKSLWTSAKNVGLTTVFRE